GAWSRRGRHTIHHDSARSDHLAIGSDLDGHKRPAGNDPLRARQRVSCRVTQNALSGIGLSLKNGLREAGEVSLLTTLALNLPRQVLSQGRADSHASLSDASAPHRTVEGHQTC